MLRWRIIIMLKQSGQWLNEIAETFSDYANLVFKVAKIFRLYENTSHEQVLQWNKSMKQKIIRYEQRK